MNQIPPFFGGSWVIWTLNFCLAKDRFKQQCQRVVAENARHKPDWEWRRCFFHLYIKLVDPPILFFEKQDDGLRREVQVGQAAVEKYVDELGAALSSQFSFVVQLCLTRLGVRAFEAAGTLSQWLWHGARNCRNNCPLETVHFEHSWINHDFGPKLGIWKGRLFVQKIALKSVHVGLLLDDCPRQFTLALAQMSTGKHYSV